MLRDELQKKIQSKSPIVKRLHRWRIRQGLGRRLAARQLSEEIGIKVLDRRIESWEQGRTQPSAAMARLLEMFLQTDGK
jgi:transcriptional regulator with XRE-family HTH domain